MNKFPNDLDLAHLIGCEVVQVALGIHDAIINLEPSNSICLMGKWLLTDPSGQTIEKSSTNKDGCRLPVILGYKITKYTVANQDELLIEFDSGITLKIIDDSLQYETCTITPEIII